jgi:hypothetical protein
MKKTYMTSMLIASCLCLSACSAGNTQTTNTLVDPNEQTETAQQTTQTADWNLKKVPYTSEAAGKIAEGDAKKKANAEQAAQETFYGNWIVKRDLKTASVSAYGQREIDKVINSKLVYSASLAKFNDISNPNPKYVKTEFTEETFKRVSQLSLKDLGIDTKSVVVVDVYTSNNEYWLGSPAGHFIVKGKNTLILADQGQYFELVRDK